MHVLGLPSPYLEKKPIFKLIVDIELWDFRLAAQVLSS